MQMQAYLYEYIYMHIGIVYMCVCVYIYIYIHTYTHTWGWVYLYGCVWAKVMHMDVYIVVFFTCMLSHALQDLEKRVYICHHLEGSLFDLRQLTAKTKSLQTLLQEVLFADDCALMAHAEQDLLLRGIQALRLDNQSRKDRDASPTCTILLLPPPTITIDNKPLANVEHFKYLESTISCDGSLDREIDNRISKASQALGSLCNRVLSKHNIRLSTKLKVYNAVVLPSLLYGCEMWTLYRRHIKKLELFHMQALRSILGIRWQDHITNLKGPQSS